MQKDWFVCLEAQGHREVAYDQNFSFYSLIWTFDTFATTLLNHHKPKCPCEKKWVTAFKVKVTVKVQNVIVCLSGQIFWTAGAFVTKLGMRIHYYGPECHAKRLVIFKVKVIMRTHIIKYDCFYHMYWTADPIATKFNWMVHNHMLESVFLCKNWIVVFKVKMTVKFQNFIESLSIL